MPPEGYCYTCRSCECQHNATYEAQDLTKSPDFIASANAHVSKKEQTVPKIFESIGLLS
jgi:hypothetical protein